MATSTGGQHWLRASPVLSGSDTASPVFPDRPIRPLPKRPLRARLSEEEADSIVYPPGPSSSSPLFGSPPPSLGPAVVNTPSSAYPSGSLPLTDSHNLNRMPPTAGYHSDPESEDEREDNTSRRSSLPHGFPPSKSRPNHSAASSGDGYESFENTNNKKKRKIPQNHPSGGLMDDLDAGISAAAAYHLDGASSPDASFASPSKSGVGIAGAGRGRHGRNSSLKKDRPSLGPSATPLNLDGSAGQVKSGHSILSSGSPDPRATPGSAIRKSQTPLKQQSPSTQPYPFSFERDSQSSNKLKEAPRPPMSNPSAMHGQPGRDVSTHGTQTGASAAAQDQRAPPPHQTRPSGQAQPPPEQPPPPSKTQQYRMAAQERRRGQVGMNARYLHQREAVTLCEFCEFKAIWHYTPRFFIRRYEEKDLKRRQDMENRRRLLEKAKAKGRKTKKNNKGGKNAQQQQPSDQGTQYDPAYEDELGPGDAQSPGEEYFDDPEYEDGALDGEDYNGDEYDYYTRDPPPPTHARRTSMAHGSVRRGDLAT